MRAGEGWLLWSLVPGCFCDPWDEWTCRLLRRGGACSGLRGELSTLLPLQPVNWVGGLGAGRGPSLSLALLTSMRPPRAAEDQGALLLVPGQHLPAAAPAQPPAIGCFNGFYSHERAGGNGLSAPRG